MDDFNSLMILKDYGSIKVKLAALLDEKGITRNKLHMLTGVQYLTIDNYYKGKVERVDLNFLAKVCCVLDCQISDLLEYQPEMEQGRPMR